ncbi:MAG: hypothetical protein U0L09_01790 [Christensenellales bacterium]|nr:hypothetical protein [Christensenellales bacterium]
MGSGNNSSDHSWLKFRRNTDIRDNAEHLSNDFAARIGYVFAFWLADRLQTTPDRLILAVGRDSRPSGQRLSDALIRGMTAADCDVFDCGLCTTPAMFMTTVMPETRANGAVMVTAGASAAEKNGFKFILPDGLILDADVEELIRRAENAAVPDRLVQKMDFLPRYAAHLKQQAKIWLDDDALKPLLGLYVIVDAGNGTGGFFADLLEELGADVTGSLNLLPDGNFPGHSPSTENDALNAIAQAVRENEADLGVLLDPDCTRAVIVNEKGQPLSGNRMIALISAILLEKHPGATIVTDSVTSSGLTQFITEWGGVHYRYRRGYRNVINEAVRLNDEDIDCPLAIETSGYAAFRENYFLDDGIYLATRLICEALNLKREGKTLSSLIEELQEPVERAEIRMNVLADDFRDTCQEIFDMILSHTLDNPDWTLAPDSREGVRINFNLDGGINNAWFQVRLSVHDPVIPLNAESDVPLGLRRMLTQLYNLLKHAEGIDLEPLRKVVENAD